MGIVSVNIYYYFRNKLNIALFVENQESKMPSFVLPILSNFSHSQ
jgi:hypothetical protein